MKPNFQTGGNPSKYGGLLMGPEYYERLAYVESRHNMDAPGGGALQLSPIAFDELKKNGYFKDRNYKDLNSQELLAGGMKYSSLLAQNYGFRNEHWNIAAYNMGPTKAKALYQKHKGDIQKAIGDPDFPQTTKNYLYDYTMAKALPERKASTDYVNQMYKIIIDGGDVNSLKPVKKQEGGTAETPIELPKVKNHDQWSTQEFKNYYKINDIYNRAQMREQNMFFHPVIDRLKSKVEELKSDPKASSSYNLKVSDSSISGQENEGMGIAANYFNMMGTPTIAAFGNLPIAALSTGWKAARYMDNFFTPQKKQEGGTPDPITQHKNLYEELTRKKLINLSKEQFQGLGEDVKKNLFLQLNKNSGVYDPNVDTISRIQYDPNVNVNKQVDTKLPEVTTTFKQAFANARNSKVDSFEFNGKKYSTNLKPKVSNIIPSQIAQENKEILNPISGMKEVEEYLAKNQITIEDPYKVTPLFGTHTSPYQINSQTHTYGTYGNSDYALSNLILSNSKVNKIARPDVNAVSNTAPLHDFLATIVKLKKAQSYGLDNELINEELKSWDKSYLIDSIPKYLNEGEDYNPPNYLKDGLHGLNNGLKYLNKTGKFLNEKSDPVNKTEFKYQKGGEMKKKKSIRRYQDGAPVYDDQHNPYGPPGDEAPISPKGETFGNKLLGQLTGKEYTGYTAPLGAFISSQADQIGMQGNQSGITGGVAASAFGGLLSGGPLGAIAGGASGLMKYAANAGHMADMEESQNKAWLAANSINGSTGRVPYFEKGGMSVRGYKSDSPDVNNDFNVIASNRITMKGVKMPVRGVGFKNGKVVDQRIMNPGEEHLFEGADHVLEIPLRSSKFQQILSKYQGGGDIPDIVPANDLVPIQTSKDEKIIHPNYDVTKVASRRSHKQMSGSGDSNKVTDTLTPMQTDDQGQTVAPGAYVVSADEKLAIPKDLAEAIQTEVKPAYYSEGKHLPEAEEKTLASEFFGNKKKLSPVKLLDKILSKYKKPENDVETDIFAKMAWEGNKKSRIPYLEMVKSLNDFMRGDPIQEPVVGTPEAGKGMKVRRYQDGGELEAFIKQRIQDLKGQQYDSSGNRTAALYNIAAGMAASSATSLQNPFSELYSTSSDLQERKFAPEDTSRIARIYDNSQANQDAIKMQVLEDAGVSAQRSPFYLSSNNSVNERNKAVVSAETRNDELSRKRAGAEDLNLRDLNNQTNKNIESNNQYLFNTTRPLVNTISNLGNLESQNATAKNQFESNKSGEIGNLLMSKYMMDKLGKYGDKDILDPNYKGDSTLYGPKGNTDISTPEQVPVSSITPNSLGIDQELFDLQNSNTPKQLLKNKRWAEIIKGLGFPLAKKYQYSGTNPVNPLR